MAHWKVQSKPVSCRVKALAALWCSEHKCRTWTEVEWYIFTSTHNAHTKTPLAQYVAESMAGNAI